MLENLYLTVRHVAYIVIICIFMTVSAIFVSAYLFWKHITIHMSINGFYGCVRYVNWSCIVYCDTKWNENVRVIRDINCYLIMLLVN